MRYLSIVLASLLLTAGRAQSQEVSLSACAYNTGQLVWEDVRHVRYGSQGHAYCVAANLAQEKWDYKLMVALDHMYFWDKTGEISRWSHRPQGGHSEFTPWINLFFGRSFELGTFDFSGMLGLGGPFGLRIHWWGAQISPAVLSEFTFSYPLPDPLPFRLKIGAGPAYLRDSAWTVLRKVAALEDPNQDPWDAPYDPFFFPVFVSITTGR